MTIKFTTEDILEISQSHIDGNSDLFTKGLNEEDAKQLLQSIESTINQRVSDLVALFNVLKKYQGESDQQAEVKF